MFPVNQIKSDEQRREKESKRERDQRGRNGEKR